MPFTDAVKQQAFARSGGRCECNRLHTGVTGVVHQGGRCPETFQQGGGWEARHKRSELAGGPSTLDNAVALCMTCCSLP